MDRKIFFSLLTILLIIVNDLHIYLLHCPFFPITVIKDLIMRLLHEIDRAGCVPCIKLLITRIH